MWSAWPQNHHLETYWDNDREGGRRLGPVIGWKKIFASMCSATADRLLSPKYRPIIVCHTRIKMVKQNGLAYAVRPVCYHNLRE